MAGKCVFYCLLLNQLKGLNGFMDDIGKIPMFGSNPDCIQILSAHPEEANLFLRPDATKGDLDFAKKLIMSHYVRYVLFVPSCTFSGTKVKNL